MYSWLIILSVISLTLQSSVCRRSKNLAPNTAVCNTQACRDLGAKFRSSMDATIHPCDNFYKFACGRWASSTPKPKFLRGKWNNLAQLSFLTQSRLKDELQSAPAFSDSHPVKLMKQFYKSCIDQRASETDAVAKILKILHETGGWPMVMGANQWNENGRTWQSVEEYFSNIEGHSVFYSINLTPGTMSNLYTLTIENSRTWPDMMRDRKTYEKLMKKVAEAVIRNINADVPSEQLDKDIDDLIAFENRLYVASRANDRGETVVDSTKFIRDFNSQTQNRAQSRIDWQKVFQRIFAITNIRPSIVNPLTIKPLRYFVELARILQSTDKRTIVNYIHWKFLAGILPHATEEMEDLYYKIENNVQDVTNKLPRWIYCVNQIGRNYASYSLFIKKYYQQSSRQNANSLYRGLLHSWKKQVKNSNWLSCKAKKDAKAKINALSAVLGYSTFYDNDEKILEYFEGLTMTDSYFANNVNYGYNMWKRQIKFWGQTASSKEILDDPLSLRAQLDRRRNTFIVTPTFLQSPLLDGTLPNYVTYSTVGAVMGHEMSHLLDYDVFKTLLTRNELRNYDDIVQCFVTIYDTYFRMAQTAHGSFDTNSASRGEFTRNENIADWNGLQFTLQAYEKMKRHQIPNGEFKLPGFGGYTDEQMFFISFAQSWCSANNEDDPNDHHAPDYLRINGVVSNIAEFGAAFNCSRNTPMHPVSKCNIWTM